MGGTGNLAYSERRCVFTAVPVSSQAAATQPWPPPSDHGGVLTIASPPLPYVSSSSLAVLLAHSQASEAPVAPQVPRSLAPTPFVWGTRCGGLGGLPRPRPGPLRGGSSPAQPRPFGGCGSLTGESCAAPEPRPELPPARVPPPRGRQPLRERLSGAYSSHHRLRCFTKWPPARSAAPGSRRGGMELLTSRTRWRKRTEVFVQFPGNCRCLRREDPPRFVLATFARYPRLRGVTLLGGMHCVGFGPLLRHLVQIVFSSLCKRREITYFA